MEAEGLTTKLDTEGAEDEDPASTRPMAQPERTSSQRSCMVERARVRRNGENGRILSGLSNPLTASSIVSGRCRTHENVKLT